MSEIVTINDDDNFSSKSSTSVQVDSSVESVKADEVKLDEVKKIEVKSDEVESTQTAETIQSTDKIQSDIKKNSKENKENEVKKINGVEETKVEETKKTTEENKKTETPKYVLEKLPTSAEKRAALASPKVTQSNSASSKPKTTQAAFSLFQNKDKEAGGTGKSSSSVVVSAAPASGPSNPNSVKDNLLRWCQINTEGYANVNITNFSSSWADGMAFCALVHHFVPETFDFNRLNPRNRKGNFDLAFKIAEEKCDIAPLLEVEDMLLMGNKPDWKCVFTYVQSFYRKFEIESKAKAARALKNV